MFMWKTRRYFLYVKIIPLPEILFSIELDIDLNHSLYGGLELELESIGKFG